MTRSSGVNHRFSVYDFSIEDEQVEKTSKKNLEKFRNPKRKRRDLFTSPVTKYTFLQTFSGYPKLQEKKSINEPIVIDDEPTDVDARQGIKTRFEENSIELVDIKTKSVGHSDEVSVQSPICLLSEGVSVNDKAHLDVTVMSSSSNCENKSLGMNTNDDGGIELDSLFRSIHVLEQNEDTDAKYCSVGVGHRIDILDDEVIVSADSVQYKGIYSTNSRLTFSTSCITIECSTVNGSKGTFNDQWAIGDIISIESDWCAQVETAWVSLYLKPKISKGIGNTNETTGDDKLTFSVYGPDWSERQEKIKSLDVRYKDIWTVVLSCDVMSNDKGFPGPNSMPTPKHYEYALDEAFDEVIYPKGDPDAVTISRRDVDLLQPETFINDTIIDFYVQFLKNKIQPEEDNRRFHFFNSFFFRKIADLDKNPSSASDGRAAFQRVSKWTRKVNLFEKDFIFIPVNYSLHWSLIVICHPCEILNFRDEASDRTLRVPCILHMDSIRGSHKGLKNLLQSYLCEEWKERHSEILDDLPSKFSCLHFIPLELPQQGNSFDCGLFLLHYLERFLEEVPTDFNPFKITQSSSSFLSKNWFPPEEASLKRRDIRRLICEIIEDHSEKIPQVESIHEYPCSKYAVHIDESETGVEFLDDKCSLMDDSSGPNTDLGIGSSLKVLHQEIKEPGLGYGDFSEQGTRTPFACENYMKVGAGRVSFMSPIEEAEEPGEQNFDSSSTSEGSCEIVQLVTKTPTSCLRQKFAHVMEIDDDDDDDDVLSCGSSTGGSQQSSEIGLDDDHSVEEYEGFVYSTESDGQDSKGIDRPDSHSTSALDELATYIVEDSQQEEDLTLCIVEDSEEANGIQHEKNTSPSPSDKELDRMDSIIFKDEMQMIDDANLASESDTHAAEKLMLMSSEGGNFSQ